MIGLFAAMENLDTFTRELIDHQVSAVHNPHRHADAVDLFRAARNRPELVERYPSFAPYFLDHAYGGFSAEEMRSMEASKNSFYWLARNNAISWLITTHFAGARRVLDVGCGTGDVTRAIGTALPHAAIYATDIFIEGIRSAASKLENRAFLMHLDATDIPFTASFDLVTSFDVLEHIPDDQRVLDQMHAALRPGGGVLHFVPQHPSLFSPADQQSHHVRRYGRHELQEKLERSGFEIVYTTSFMFFLLPFFAMSRFLSKLRGAHSVAGEHQQPTSIATTFGLVQDLELFLMRRGWRFPVGVSRAVVARRR